MPNALIALLLLLGGARGLDRDGIGGDVDEAITSEIIYSRLPDGTPIHPAMRHAALLSPRIWMALFRPMPFAVSMRAKFFFSSGSLVITSSASLVSRAMLR